MDIGSRIELSPMGRAGVHYVVDARVVLGSARTAWTADLDAALLSHDLILPKEAWRSESQRTIPATLMVSVRAEDPNGEVLGVRTLPHLFVTWPDGSGSPPVLEVPSESRWTAEQAAARGPGLDDLDIAGSVPDDLLEPSLSRSGPAVGVIR